MTPDMLPARFAAKILVDEGRGCWIFTGALNSKGYGCIAVDGDGSTRLAHRAAYELLVGPIPEGLVTDHLCLVKSCCNPAHLEPVTSAENNRRAIASGQAYPVLAARNAAKTHCQQGHPYAGENLIVRRGERFCKACSRNYDARRRLRKLELIESGQIARAAS